MPFNINIGRNESDKKLFGETGLIPIGKTYVTMGNYTSLSNPLYMDVARSHVVLVAGKRGGGKCLTENSMISLEDGGLISIKDLKKCRGNVISMNKDMKLCSSSISEFFERTVNKTLKIELASGREIELTPEHPLYTLLGWKPAEELMVGSRIAVPRILPTFGKNEMSLHEVKLLSYLVAEGHTKSVVLFSNIDEEIIEDFKKSLYNFDSTLKMIKEKEGHFRISNPNHKTRILNFYDVTRDSSGRFVQGKGLQHEKRSIRKLLEREELFNKLSTQKYLSQNILKLKKDLLRVFLNRLFSCDGSIYRNGNSWRISYASSSEKLIRQVQNLILRFGVLSKLRKKKINRDGKVFHSFELVIDSVNVGGYIREIGFFGKKKIKEKEALRELQNKEFNPNVDTIPKEIWENFKPVSWSKIGRDLGYAHPKAMRERVNYCPSRETLLKIGKSEKNEELIKIATSDIFWDKIVSIKTIKKKIKVYDISVPSTHNFVANDIIVHNSYTMGVMAEAICNLEEEIAQNISTLLFDTMGIYWTMKFKNQKDKELLSDWGLEPKNVPVKIFVPFGHYEEYRRRGIPVDVSFALKISELDSDDWISLFELKFTQPEAVLIESVISKLKSQGSFSFKDIKNMISKAENISQDVKNSVVALFDAAETWGVFNEEIGTKISDLIAPGQSSVLDLSMYVSIGSFNVRALIIGLVSKRLFNERMEARRNEEIQAVQHGLDYLYFKPKREMPLVWIFIDEAHEFLPKEGKTSATDALVQLLREGRQPGISMVMATQQPGKIHTDAMTQSDIVISHRLTAESDINALNQIMQSYVTEGIKAKMDALPTLKGSALVLDDNSERIYPVRIRPRFTWHGGEAPTAVKVVERE